MSLYTQETRRLAIFTPLGEDALLLDRCAGTERLSGLFRFELEMSSEHDDLDYKKIVGQPVTIELREEGDERPRFFHGHVARFAYLGRDDRLSHYRAEVVPWLWFLTRNADCRIFREKTVPEIIEEIFQAHGFSDYEIAVSGSHPKREFCVQYRESDFDFISRLMEEEGVFYFFRHKEDKHTLVLADAKSAYEDCPDVDRNVELVGNVSQLERTDRIRKWEHAHYFRTGRAAQNDFNFKDPNGNLKTSTSTKMKVRDAEKFECYEYPGRYDVKADGDELTRLRMEEVEAGHDVARGESVCRGFAPGLRFTLVDHDCVTEKDKTYVLTEVRHDMRCGGEESSRISESVHESEEYVNEFVCIPDSVTFRPESATPKPIVHGSQTATVVGPEGEEIYTDEYGRVKVQFHWDRYGKADADSSCWVRVSQLFAGKKWGAMFIPRIGHEVIVDFLEGDPDRPIITGRVYNAEQKVPYDLPGNKTISTIKTLSSKDGEGFNEIRFEDKKGEEQIFIHGEKNFDTRIKNDAFEWIGRNRHLIVKRDQLEHVENNRQEKVDADHMEEIGKDRHVKVRGKEAIEIGESHSFTVKGDVIEVFKGNHSSQVTQNLYVKAMGVVIEAMQGITLKVGGSCVVIDPSGVTVKGPMVTLDGSMVKIASGPGSPAGSGSAGNAVAPAAPEAAEEADVADPGEVSKVKAQQMETGKGKYGANPPPAHNPAQADEKKTSWIEIELVDQEDNPVPGEYYEVTLPDGETVASGTLDANGFARVDGIDPGQCKVSFPRLDEEAWEQA